MEDRGNAVQDPEELRRTLEERVKALNCLYGISRIVERGGGSLETILREIVNLLPSSWQYPKISCARVVLDGTEFKTDNFTNTRWKQAAELRVHGTSAGAVEIGYLEEKPTRAEGPFLAEERVLLNAVAERIGRVVERLRAWQSLRTQEAELRSRLTHLTRVNTMGEMASSIAHEVNQPLTAIATYTQACTRMLKAGTTNTNEILDILGRVTEEAIRAGDIIHRLKDLVRKRGSRRTVCDVNELIRDMEELASVDARLHNVKLDFQLSDPLPAVFVDGIQIQQVMLNLIRNGVDAIADSDTQNRDIFVRTRLGDHGMVEISVTDTGCGLPQVSDEELFQPFFTTKNDGMGMGLSVSRSIVTFHGGKMWFSRNRDGGTTFFVTVPVVSEEDDGRG